MKVNARELAVALSTALLGAGCTSTDTPTPDRAAKTAAAPTESTTVSSVSAASAPARVTTAAPVGSVSGPKHACGAGKCGDGSCG